MSPLCVPRSGLKNIECSQLSTNKPIEDKISIKYLFGLDIIELELYLAHSETIELSLFDLLGRSLTKEKLSFRFYYNLDISTLVSGVYFLNLQIWGLLGGVTTYHMLLCHDQMVHPNRW